MDILQGLGALLSCYGCYGLFTGAVWAKDGISAREVFKEDEPKTFWLICCCYIGVGGMIYFI